MAANGVGTAGPAPTARTPATTLILRELSRFFLTGVKWTGRPSLGVGAYGSVEPLELNGMACAGKRIHDILVDVGNEGAEEIAARFVEECKLMSDLRHPHVVQFLGLCLAPSSSLPILVMEHLYCSLDDLLETTRDIPLYMKRAILRDVALGLAHLHGRHPAIIHRDLTARNVLLNNSMRAKLADFGVARILNLPAGKLEATLSRVPGTSTYMPPEVFSREAKYNTAVDIFSFGHLLLFTITQKQPGHGIPDADLRHDDTLSNPAHVEDGELQRFDRVITNPPFSQNYDKTDMAHQERFRYGYTPEGGKKADLMFLQHMLAVLRPKGLVATVMPHGVLFRGGVEGDIRRQIIEDDPLEAVIGLAPNLFYGTGIPAAILILRAKNSKPRERQGKVLFINADHDYGEGRAQNHLRPRDEEKITAAYRDFADVDGFAKVVTIDELANNDFNCNIRRYADSSPPPEPHDVRAHLHGGVPMAEIGEASELLERVGVTALDVLFADRGDGYADWRHDIASTEGREAAHGVVSAAVAQRAAVSPWSRWWADTVVPVLLALPDWLSLAGLRQQVIESFVGQMTPAELDSFEAAGMAATWWDESVYELQTAASRGWKAVIEAWLTTAEADQSDNGVSDLADQIAIKLLAGSELADRVGIAAELARLDVEITAAEASRKYAETDEFNECAVSPAELRELKSMRSEAKKALAAVDASLLLAAREAYGTISANDAPDLAIEILRTKARELVDQHFAVMQRNILAWYDNLVDKYGTTLRELEHQRGISAARLDQNLAELGYA